MPALRITGPQRAISASRWVLSPSGVILSAGGMSELRSAKRCFTTGSCKAKRSAVLSFFNASGGVPLGAYRPCQTLTSKPLRPCSSSVGTFGSAVSRRGTVTPNTLTRPSLITPTLFLLLSPRQPRGHGAPDHLAAGVPDRRAGLRGLVAQQVSLPAQQVVHRRACAFVGHGGQLDADLAHEQQAAQVRDGAQSGIG